MQFIHYHNNIYKDRKGKHGESTIAIRETKTGKNRL
jgi:hypothetical protein